MKRPFPARLHVLMARDCKQAVIIRRGPSRHTAIIGWDRHTDQFKLGQWLYGRIYERRCDLSPDGRHLIYFAMNGRWSSATKGSWTAISKAPYLKALTLYAKGDCWNGGGLFRSDREYWLNDGPMPHEKQIEGSKLERVDIELGAAHAGECPMIYYDRLQRDGWVLQEPDTAANQTIDATFEKAISNHWTLHKRAHASAARTPGKGCYFDEHLLFNARTQQVLHCPTWEWAEQDGHRVVWAEGGKLFAGRLAREGWDWIKELADFNDMRFEPMQAPY